MGDSRTPGIVVTKRKDLEIIVGEREGTCSSNPQVVSALAGECWRLDFDDSTINLVQMLIYSSVNGVMTPLAPRVAPPA